MAYGNYRTSGGRLAPESLARGLGWFSIALGVTELFMARGVSRAAGLNGKAGVVRAYGMRELGNGMGILASKHPATQAPWIWARVAGDVLDIATVASGFRAGRRSRVATSLLLLAGVTVVDVVCASELLAAEKRKRRNTGARDYSDRSGFPQSAEEMRGKGRDASQRVPRKPEPAQPRLSS